MATLTVGFDTPTTAARYLPLLAGLPAHFDAATGRADITVVDGTSPGWPDAAGTAAEQAGAVVVWRPRPDPRFTGGRFPVPVFADLAYSADPTWTTALPKIQAGLPATAIIESRVTATGPGELLDGLVAQLALLRALLGEVSWTTADRTAGHLLTGHADAVAVSLSGALGPAGLQLNTVGARERWQIDFAPPGPARPTRATRFDRFGSLGARPRFETAQRSLWRAIHSVLTTGATPGHQLAELAPDLATIAGLPDHASTLETS